MELLKNLIDAQKSLFRYLGVHSDFEIRDNTNMYWRVDYHNETVEISHSNDFSHSKRIPISGHSDSPSIYRASWSDEKKEITILALRNPNSLIYLGVFFNNKERPFSDDGLTEIGVVEINGRREKLYAKLIVTKKQ